MQSFNNHEEMIRTIRSDLVNRIFPEFIRVLGEATVAKLRDGVREQAVQVNDSSVPEIPDPDYTKIPPRVSIMMLYQGKSEMAAAYDGAFQDFYEQNVRDKPNFLKFLRDSGVK